MDFHFFSGNKGLKFPNSTGLIITFYFDIKIFFGGRGV
jgi:hypothetical protein